MDEPEEMKVGKITAIEFCRKVGHPISLASTVMKTWDYAGAPTEYTADEIIKIIGARPKSKLAALVNLAFEHWVKFQPKDVE